MKVAVITTDNRQHYRNYASATPDFGAAPEALLKGFAVLPDLEVHILSCLMEPVKSPTRLAENIYYHSLHVPRLGWMRTLFQGCIRSVHRKLKTIRPDIVHGQGTERECAVSAAFSGFPNVLTVHGNMAELAHLFHKRMGSYGWLAGQLEGIALGRSLGVFCNSEYTENLVKPRARKTWRVPNAIREAFFAPPKTAPAPGKCVLVNVGVISERKRQVELLDVARRLHEQGFKLELQFIGLADPQIPYSAGFLARVKDAEAKGYARYLGFKSVDELIACFDAAHALVHFPSEEAFGLVVPEAIARNLKLFGARVGGLIDIAHDVPGADLFDASDWSGLTAAIGSWIRSGHPKSSSCAEMVRARYHPRVIAERHLEIYREVLGTSS